MEQRVCLSANPSAFLRIRIDCRCTKVAINRSRPKSTPSQPQPPLRNDRRLPASRGLPCPIGPLSLPYNLNHTVRANRPRSAHPSHTAGGTLTAALRTSANCRPTRGPSVRATSRSFSLHRREIGEVTAETNLQHRDRLLYALPAASYNALRDSVPPFALVGSNSGGLPRAAPCSAGVDTADGLPVCVHLLVSVVDVPVRPCYWPMSAIKPITPLRSRPPIRTTSQR